LDETLPRFKVYIGIVFGPPTDYPVRFSGENDTRVR
jgi:hypothetical protein